MNHILNSFLSSKSLVLCDGYIKIKNFSNEKSINLNEIINDKAKETV